MHAGYRKTSRVSISGVSNHSPCLSPVLFIGVARRRSVCFSLQRLTGPEPPPAGSPDGEEDMAALAGARLLSRYQDQWSRLHTNAERAVTAADVSSRSQ